MMLLLPRMIYLYLLLCVIFFFFHCSIYIFNFPGNTKINNIPLILNKVKTAKLISIGF